jgi:hypothetical protein
VDNHNYHTIGFCKTEENLYSELIDLMEIDVNDDNILEYNGVPLKVKGRILLRLCDETMSYNRKLFITFKPLKNHKHCQLLINYIHEEIKENYEIITKRIPSGEDDRFLYIGKIYDPELDLIVLESTKSYSEIEAKFKVLASFLLNRNVDKEINDIKRFDTRFNKISN